MRKRLASRSRWCCSRPPARRTTSIAISRSAGMRSAIWCMGCRGFRRCNSSPARGRSASLRAGTRLPPRLLLRLEQVEIDRFPHRQIAGAVGVELVARTSRGAFRNELGFQAPGPRVKRDLVEIDHAVEQAAGTNELVERLALLILFGKSVRRARRAE